MTAALAPRGCRRITSRSASTSSGGTTTISFPSLATYRGSRPSISDRQPTSVRNQADAGGSDEDLIALATIDDLGIASDQGHARFVTGRPHRYHDAPQVGHGQPLLKDEGRGEE